MASVPFKNSLKRQRRTDGVSIYDYRSNNDHDNDDAGETIKKYRRGRNSAKYDCRQHCDQTSCFFFCAMGITRSVENPYPHYSSYKIPRGRKCPLFFRGIIGPFVVLLLSRYALGETQYHDNNAFENTRDIRYQSWEGEGYQGNHGFFNRARGRDLESAGKRVKQDGLATTIIENERVLQSGEKLQKFIQQRSQSTNENLLPALRNSDAESFGGSEPANEIDVSSSPLQYGESFKTGNLLIQNKQPIDFEVQILVEDTITNELLKDLEVFLENYIEGEYKKFIDGNRDGSRNASTMSNSDLETVKLGKVDLVLQLLDSERWQERQRRQLHTELFSSMRGSLRSKQRRMQNDPQLSNAKLMTIDVIGSVDYSVEVDGSLPTPDEIEEQWDDVYREIISQNQLQRAIEDSDIEGVLRVEEVTPEEDPTDKSDSGFSDGDGINEDSDGGTTNDDASLYQNGTGKVDQDLISNASESNSDTKNSGKKSPPELERPSLLSIIFGFTLTGIAVLGLVGYACIFCRKRKKRLAKKKKMKESITFSSANLATAAAATAASNGKQNSQYPSKSKIQSASRPVQAAYPSQLEMPSMMLSQTESVETTYRGIESSVGSEDIADSFANELRLAASRDQEAWNEFQRRKETLEKRKTTSSDSVNRTPGQNPQSSFSPVVPPMPSKRPERSEGPKVNTEANRADLEGRDSFMGSFPYGDESRMTRGDGYGSGYGTKNDQPKTSKRWEPYNSSLSLTELSLTEEKKDETSAADFFAKKLSDIEKDLGVSGGQPIIPHYSRSTETKSTDDASNSDILSEVSELSRYVRRYERRKDRKHKREEFVHERVNELAPSQPAPLQPFSPNANTMSIGMDGRVYNPHGGNQNQNTSSSPLSTRGMHPAPLSSYAESYISQKHEESGENSLSFVSDDEDEPGDGSITSSQRLGITPYKVTQDEIYYNSDDNSFSGRGPSRVLDDYRYSVGYSGNGQDNSKSSSSRLANLRANDAIIDNSSSEINLSIDEKIAARSGTGMVRPNPQRADNAKNTTAVTSSSTTRPRSNRTETSKTNRFDRIRGLFEQKSSDHLTPVYPPGEHWQYGGAHGKQ
eukprot:jgi/Psemu1/21878/gm1.21878_g